MDVRELLLKVTGDSRDAEQALNRIARRVIETGKTKASPRVEITGLTEATAKLAAMQGALDAIDREKVSPEVNVQIDRSLARLAILKAELTKVFKTPAAERDVAAVASVLTGVAREAGNVGSVMEKAASPTGGLNAQFSGLLGAVKQVNPILQGMGIIILTLLIPAFLALAASLVGAIGAIGGLATALAAIAGPLILGLVAVIQRVAAVMKVRQERQAALNADTRKGAQADEQARQNAEALHNAQNTLRDAIEARKTATEQLRTAEQDARDGIVKAQQDQADAARNLGEQEAAAYTAMRDAAERARQAVLDVESARLSVSEAKLNTRQAQQDLDDFRKKAGLTAGTLDGLFKKFTNVKADDSKLKAALRGAAATAGVALGQDDELALEQKVLAVKRARLTEKQSVEAVAQATNSLADANKNNNAFQQQGIRAFQPYVDALRRASDAQKALSVVEAQGVTRNPQVVSARHALRDANQRVTEATHDLKTATDKQSGAFADQSGPMAIYLRDLAKLSTGEQKLLDLIVKAGPTLRHLGQSITDPVISAVVDGINSVHGGLDRVKSFASQLGTVYGQNVRKLFADLTGDPLWARAMREFGAAALMVGRALGGIFPDFLAIMRNIALTFLPGLVGGFRSLAGSLRGLRAGTSNIDSMRKSAKPFLDSLSAIWGLVKAVGRALLAFVGAAAPSGNSLLGSLTKGVDTFTGFLKSAKGKNTISKFFKDTLPAVKSLVRFLVLLGAAFLQAIQFIAPAIKVVLDTFNLLLLGVNFLLGLLNKIPAPIRSLLAVFFPFGTVLRLAFKPLELLGPLFAKIIEALPGLSKAFSGAGGVITRVFGAVFERLPRIVRSAINTVVRIASGLGGRIGSALGAAGKLIAAAFALIRGVFSKAIAPVRGIIDLFVGGIRRGFEGIGGIVRRVFGGVLSVVKSYLNLIIDAANLWLRALNAITGLVNKLPSINIAGHKLGIPDIPAVPLIPKLAAGGITTGPTLAQIGEAGREAVVPLRTSVLRQLAGAIVGAMPRGAAAAALRGGGPALAVAGGDRINHFHIPPAPGGDLPDARVLAVKLAREMDRRGG
jgi:phage-related protein